jgi:hypothetical protein
MVARKRTVCAKLSFNSNCNCNCFTAEAQRTQRSAEAISGTELLCQHKPKDLLFGIPYADWSPTNSSGSFLVIPVLRVILLIPGSRPELFSDRFQYDTRPCRHR